MNENLLALLSPVTEEEKSILAGQKGIDPNLYYEGNFETVQAKKLLAEGKLITLRTHTRFVHFPAHSHDYVEAVYMCSGETRHVVNGKEICLKEGELLLLGQSAVQEILPASEKDVAVNLIIMPPFFYKTLEMLGSEETPLQQFLIRSLFGEENAGYLHFQVSEVIPVQNLLENLIWTLLYDVPNKRNISETTMGLLFMQLLNHTDKLAHQTKEEAVVLKVFRYIEEHYQKGSLKELSQILHQDFFYLSHKIREQTGKTFTEHVQEKRLSQASYLLKNTSLGIERIAAAVGYENKSYFYRLFFKRFGVSPKKYREEMQE